MTVDATFIEGLVAELNELGEHTQIEAKTASEVGKSALETVCAFSNEPDLGGGHLLLGVARKKDPDLFGDRPYVVVGVPDPERVSAELASRCATEFDKPIRPRVTPVKMPGGVVLHVRVDEAQPQDKPVVLSRFGTPRGAFRRTSEGDFKGTQADYALLLGDQRGETYDRQVARRAALDDLDPAALRTYKKLLQDSGRSADVLEFSDDEVLQALGAVDRVGGEWRPTVAGVLLFGTRLALRRDFPMMRVDYLRVAGTEWVEDPLNRYDALIEIRAPLLTALRRAETAVLDDLPRKFHLPEGSLQRQDILPLPRKVLREAIVNALMHRDYQAHGPIQIIRFANRIEIHNPGYSLKPPDQLGQPNSLTRNPAIASVFHDTDLAETKGTGIGTMRRLMEKAELAPPTFESERAENRFVARIPLTHFLSRADLRWLDGTGEDLSPHERIVLVHVRDGGTVNNEAVRKMTGLDSLSASTLLRRLCALDLLSKEGGGTATFYLPTPRFLSSLPEGVTVPGFEGDGLSPGQPGMSGTQPGESAGKSGKSAAQPDKSGGQRGQSAAQTGEPTGQSSMSATKSSMSEGKSPMLPPDLREMAEEIGGKADDATMRAAVVRLCHWRPLSARELAAALDRTPDYLSGRYLRPMVAEGALALTIPDKPRSRYQKYTTPDAP